jgi:hypothetical protein
VEGIAIAGQRLTVTVDGGRVEVAGAGPLEIVPRARPPLTASLPH